MLTTMVIVKTQLHNNKDKGSGTGGHGKAPATFYGGGFRFNENALRLSMGGDIK